MPKVLIFFVKIFCKFKYRDLNEYAFLQEWLTDEYFLYYNIKRAYTENSSRDMHEWVIKCRSEYSKKSTMI